MNAIGPGRWTLKLFCSVLLSALAAGALLWAAEGPSAGQNLPPFDFEITRVTRLLVLAPHPDDEALGAAGLIARVRARGGAVQVVLLTSGDGFPEAVEAARGITNPKPSDYRGFGLRREQETRTAMAALGVPSSRITFLGFPDEGLCLLASTYLFDKRRSFESPYTDRVRPPPTEQLVRGAKYRGIDVRRELERTVTDFAPTLIVLPHPEDDHPDHCSTHIFAREALEAVRTLRSPRLRVLHYLVHFGQWPLTADVTDSRQLTPPEDFPAAEGRWVSLALTPEEAAARQRAILTYQSQVQVIGRFMRAFARDNELYLEGEPASLPECWCDGQNVATELPPSRYRRRP
ncbi:MAG: PIG-L family deacetylase [Acidobacteriota bacterium]